MAFLGKGSWQIFKILRLDPSGLRRALHTIFEFFVRKTESDLRHRETRGTAMLGGTEPGELPRRWEPPVFQEGHGVNSSPKGFGKNQPSPHFGCRHLSSRTLWQNFMLLAMSLMVLCYDSPSLLMSVRALPKKNSNAYHMFMGGNIACASQSFNTDPVPWPLPSALRDSNWSRSSATCLWYSATFLAGTPDPILCCPYLHACPSHIQSGPLLHFTCSPGIPSLWAVWTVCNFIVALNTTSLMLTTFSTSLCGPAQIPWLSPWGFSEPCGILGGLLSEFLPISFFLANGRSPGFQSQDRCPICQETLGERKTNGQGSTLRPFLLSTLMTLSLGFTSVCSSLQEMQSKLRDMVPRL